MNFRTDLALERREYIEKKEIDGIICETKNESEVKVTTITVINQNGEKVLGKPQGKYITLEVKPFTKSADISEDCIEVLSREINKLLPKEGAVLVAGLGNEKITPDALGPKCISLLLATRHINDELASSIGLGKLRSVAGISPGVLGRTGIETAEIIDGIVKKINPAAVIIIDALASRKLSRLGTTVQMTDSGISPGSGVGNMRSAIDKNTLGVPVVAIGVPTVVDGATMACDLLEKQGVDISKLENESEFRKQGSMMVTPKEIDLVIERAAQFIALGINKAMQPNLSTEDILAIVK